MTEREHRAADELCSAATAYERAHMAYRGEPGDIAGADAADATRERLLVYGRAYGVAYEAARIEERCGRWYWRMLYGEAPLSWYAAFAAVAWICAGVSVAANLAAR